jgi:hypothetical protein
VALTDRDIENYYNERRDEFRQEEEVCASHILFKLKATPMPRRATPRTRRSGSRRGHSSG